MGLRRLTSTSGWAPCGSSGVAFTGNANAPRRALADRLGDPDEVALAVVEERAEFLGALARVVVGGGDRVAADLEARHLEALEGHTSGSQVGQGASRFSTSWTLLCGSWHGPEHWAYYLVRKLGKHC